MNHRQVETGEGNQTNATIELGKWWKPEQRGASVLPDDLNWFKPECLQSYEEFADSISTAQLHPYQFTLAISKLAEQAGARVIFGTVDHINCSNSSGTHEDSTPLPACQDWLQKRISSVTYTNKASGQQQTLPATIAILAAGPWTPNLLPKLRMSPLRAHSITVKVNKPLSAYCLFTEIAIKMPLHPDPKKPSSKLLPRKTFSIEIYSRPNNEVYICSQGDLNVSLPAPTEIAPVSELSCRDVIDAVASISDELRNGQVTGKRACYLPVIDASVSEGPLVGETGLEGLLLATAHSCWGILNAPATGKAISELVFDGEISCMHAENLDPRIVFSKSWG
jgi:glycine/D-amino acid oxidase-like deaminating enzyme